MSAELDPPRCRRVRRREAQVPLDGLPTEDRAHSLGVREVREWHPEFRSRGTDRDARGQGLRTEHRHADGRSRSGHRSSRACSERLSSGRATCSNMAGEQVELADAVQLDASPGTASASAVRAASIRPPACGLPAVRLARADRPAPQLGRDIDRSLVAHLGHQPEAGTVHSTASPSTRWCFDNTDSVMDGAHLVLTRGSTDVGMPTCRLGDVDAANPISYRAKA